MVEEKEEYIYKSFLALGQYSIILGEIKDNANISVGKRSIRLMASFLSDPSNREIASLQMKEWLSDPVASQNKTLQTMAATMFVHEDNVKEAFRVLKNGSNIEQLAFTNILRFYVIYLPIFFTFSIDTVCSFNYTLKSTA